MTNKMPSPWSADFYRTNTVKTLDDTIEHGGPGSGRYPKGSGKDPRNTSSGRTTREKRKRDERFTRGIPRDASIDGPRPLKPGEKTPAEFMKKHNIPVEHSSGPASKKEISDAEKEIGVPFSKEYKSILSHHGILAAGGHEMIGVVPGKPDSNRNTTKATKFERDNDPKAPKDAYVVENTGWDGLMIWQKTDGTVYERYPNEPKLTKVSDSLADWLNT